MHKSRRILLADRDSQVQDAVEEIAKQYGYEIIRVKTGADVLAQALELRLDLVVLEVSLPDADGRDLLAQLKKDQRTRRIPVLIWSARDPESDRRIALDLGAEDYMEKSDAPALLAKIRRLLFRLDKE